MSYGLLGVGEGLKDVGKIILGYDRDRTERQERDKRFAFEKKQHEDMLARQLAQQEIAEQDLMLRSAAGSRAEQELGLARDTHRMGQQDRLRQQVARLGTGSAVPESMASSARDLGIFDQTVDAAPEGMNMAPGAQAPPSGLPPEMLISQNYAREMRTPDEISKVVQTQQAHESELASEAQARRTSEAQMRYYGQLGAAVGQRQDNVRPELARNFPVFQAALQNAQKAHADAMKPLLSIGAVALPAAQRAQIEAQVAAAAKMVEDAQLAYDLARQAIAGEGVNKKVDPAVLQTLQTGQFNRPLSNPPTGVVPGPVGPAPANASPNAPRRPNRFGQQ
jgi:hypothetical protein